MFVLKALWKLPLLAGLFEAVFRGSLATPGLRMPYLTAPTSSFKFPL
jgi:hypothetical protein